MDVELLHLRAEVPPPHPERHIDEPNECRKFYQWPDDANEGLAGFIEGNFVTAFAERQIVKLPPPVSCSTLLGIGYWNLGIALAAPLTAAVSGVVFGAVAGSK